MKNSFIKRSLFLLCIMLALWTGVTVAKTITVDGDASDWTGIAPSQVHGVQYSNNEWIYQGAYGDNRTDPDPPNYRWDIYQLRLAADSDNLYLYVDFNNNVSHEEVNFALSIDTDSDGSDTGLIFLGDESGVVLGDPIQYGEKSINLHWTPDGNLSVEIYSDDGSDWYPPVDWQAVYHDSEHFAEARISLTDLGLSPGVSFRISGVSLDNEVGWNDFIDTTQDYVTCDALDVIGGQPGLMQNAWDRDLSDGDVDYNYIVVLNNLQTPVPTASPAPTHTPGGTATPEPTATGSGTPTETPTGTPAAIPTTSSGGGLFLLAIMMLVLVLGGQLGFIRDKLHVVLILTILLTNSTSHALPQRDYKAAVIKAADRLVALQNSNGTWPLEVTTLDSATGTGSEKCNGLVAEALLTAYRITFDPAYLQAAIKTADWIVDFRRQHEWLYNPDTLFLRHISDLNVPLATNYKLHGRLAATYLHDIKRPSAQDIIHHVSNIGTDISWRLANYIRVFQAYGFHLTARRLITDPNGGLLSLQAKTGGGAGAFLSARDYTPDEDHYWMRDTVNAVLALYEVAPFDFREQIRDAFDLLMIVDHYNINHPGALPAGYLYNKVADEWRYLPWRFSNVDHAMVIGALSLTGLRDLAEPGFEYLARNQRTQPGFEGWYERTTGWEGFGAASRETEFIVSDAETIKALVYRLYLNQQPTIRLAGWLNTSISNRFGGTTDVFAWTGDPDGDRVLQVELYLDNQPTGNFIPRDPQLDNVFWLSGGTDPLEVYPGAETGWYFVQMAAYDEVGATSDLWPYLHLKPPLSPRPMREKYSSYSHDELDVILAITDRINHRFKEFTESQNLPAIINPISIPLPWEFAWEKSIRRATTSQADTNTQYAPMVLAAGYFDTDLVTAEGGDLTMLAWVMDLDGLEDIASVEVFFQSRPLGLRLLDDGNSGDFVANDGLYGVRLRNLRPMDLVGWEGCYTLEIVAYDRAGRPSYPWPYFVITD